MSEVEAYTAHAMPWTCNSQ